MTGMKGDDVEEDEVLLSASLAYGLWKTTVTMHDPNLVIPEPAYICQASCLQVKG
jgi:hypothetical protein